MGTDVQFLAAESAGEKAVCRRCRRTGPKFPPPQGWYSVSVNVPKTIDKRGYVWVGLFCSLSCLAFHMPTMKMQDDMTQDLYERD